MQLGHTNPPPGDLILDFRDGESNKEGVAQKDVEEIGLLGSIPLS